MANGNELHCHEVCKGLQWEVQGRIQVTEVLFLPLLGCDMVLGVQWLKTLGPIWWDFNLLVMKFCFHGLSCTWQGLLAGEVKLLSEH